jgi:hypothetical protein
MHFLWMALAILVTGSDPVPSALTVAGQQQPFFFSAASVTDSDGRFRWDAVPEPARDLLRVQVMVPNRAISSASESARPCPTHTTISHWGEAPPHRTLDELLASADAIYRGRIKSVTPGFLLQSPATLLAVGVERAVRRGAAYPTGDTIYITHLVADFSVDGTRFCDFGPNDGFVPQAGDEILLLANTPADDMTGRYLKTTPEQVFFSRNGKVIGATSLRALTLPASLDDFERESRHIGRKRVREQP